jgi:hypothetical protein
MGRQAGRGDRDNPRERDLRHPGRQGPGLPNPRSFLHRHHRGAVRTGHPDRQDVPERGRGQARGGRQGPLHYQGTAEPLPDPRPPPDDLPTSAGAGDPEAGRRTGREAAGAAGRGNRRAHHGRSDFLGNAVGRAERDHPLRTAEALRITSEVPAVHPGDAGRRSLRQGQAALGAGVQAASQAGCRRGCPPRPQLERFPQRRSTPGATFRRVGTPHGRTPARGRYAGNGSGPPVRASRSRRERRRHRQADRPADHARTASGHREGPGALAQERDRRLGRWETDYRSPGTGHPSAQGPALGKTVRGREADPLSQPNRRRRTDPGNQHRTFVERRPEPEGRGQVPAADRPDRGAPGEG